MAQTLPHVDFHLAEETPSFLVIGQPLYARGYDAEEGRTQGPDACYIEYRVSYTSGLSTMVESARCHGRVIYARKPEDALTRLQHHLSGVGVIAVRIFRLAALRGNEFLSPVEDWERSPDHEPAHSHL